MKTLIYFACYTVALIVLAIIRTFSKIQFGFEPGLILDVPVILLTGFAANALSKKIAAKHETKSDKTGKAPATYEDIKDKVSKAVIEKCEEQRGNDKELRATLDFSVENAFIKREYYGILFEEFRKK